MVDLEVIGRHALLFDDDTMAAFVNSTDALVQWNSLLIDRYDVRHLLSSLPPRKTRQLARSTTSSTTNFDLDHERYQDLPPPSAEEELGEEKFVDTGGYRAVAFSYGIPNDSTDQNKPDAGIETSGFVPPFPVPENLLQSLERSLLIYVAPTGNLYPFDVMTKGRYRLSEIRNFLELYSKPPTYKSHQIIARTALFVAAHGGQSEIILRVKQGDNPTFGFLMPDNHLHPYFRFLVENKHLLKSDSDVKSVKEKGDFENNQSGGALSLLGSVYGSGEDEDAVGKSEESKENMTKKGSFDGSSAFRHGSDKAESPLIVDGGDQMVLKRPNSSKSISLKKNTPIGELKTATSHNTRKCDSNPVVSVPSEKLETSSIQNVSKSKPPVLEPPSDIKRSINKIIEFIIKNGKQYEAVLIEQDKKYDRFPFLLPSSQYHPYYSKVLQEANQSKLTVKSFPCGKSSSSVQGQDKNGYLEKERDVFSLGPSGYDNPYDSSDRKEKFKMVIGKSKKDMQNVGGPPQIGISVDAAAAAAILHAATRGLKYHDLGILTNGNKRGRCSEGGVHSGTDEGANETDSTETNVTKDQKMKAERLKRAKMFVAKIKNEPFKTDKTTGHISSPGKGGIVSVEDKEREVKSVPLDHTVDYSSEKKRKLEKRCDEDEYGDRRKSRRKYRSKSSRVHEEEDEEEESEYEKRRDHHYHKQQKQHHSSRHTSHQSSDDKEEEEKRDRKRSRKRYQTNDSSKYEEEEADRDEGSHKQHSRRKKRHHGSHYSDDEEVEVMGEKDDDGREVKYRRKKHMSSSSDHHSRDNRERNNYSSSSSKKRHEGRRAHRGRDSSDWDDGGRKQRKKKRDCDDNDDKLLEELEEGEIDGSSTKVGLVDEEEATVVLDDLSVCNNNNNNNGGQQPSSSEVVSEDLRAKIRAMLMANM